MAKQRRKDGARTIVLRVLVNKRERLQIADLAKRAGRSLSSWLREQGKRPAERKEIGV